MDYRKKIRFVNIHINIRNSHSKRNIFFFQIKTFNFNYVFKENLQTKLLLKDSKIYIVHNFLLKYIKSKIFPFVVHSLDADGNFSRINFSIPQRDSHFNVADLDTVLRWYEAFGKFVDMVKEETVLFKVNQGDILTFSNVRLLHGREAYDDSKTNVRYVVGAYMDWDIIYSKWRVLKNQLANKH